MPSSELAFKSLYSAIDARTKAYERPGAQHLHTDVFVETGGVAATHALMFMFRSTTIYLPNETPTIRYGVFARVDRRCATAPRIEPIPTDDVTAFLDSLPALSLGPIPVHTQARDGHAFEVRIRDMHFDVTIHFANPREPRSDLIALGAAIDELGKRLTE